VVVASWREAEYHDHCELQKTKVVVHLSTNLEAYLEMLSESKTMLIHNSFDDLSDAPSEPNSVTS